MSQHGWTYLCNVRLAGRWCWITSTCWCLLTWLVAMATTVLTLMKCGSRFSGELWPWTLQVFTQWDRVTRSCRQPFSLHLHNGPCHSDSWFTQWDMVRCLCMQSFLLHLHSVPCHSDSCILSSRVPGHHWMKWRTVVLGDCWVNWNGRHRCCLIFCLWTLFFFSF